MKLKQTTRNGITIKQYYFDSPNFTIDGSPRTIIGSRSTGYSTHDVDHWVMKEDKTAVWVSMLTLIELFKAGRLI